MMAVRVLVARNIIRPVSRRASCENLAVLYRRMRNGRTGVIVRFSSTLGLRQMTDHFLANTSS